jgi:iron(II)-dependent oxidoreductase
MMPIQASSYLATLFCLATITAANAQDSSFKPVGQQIPAPSCLTVHSLWEGGSPVCDQKTHDAWLKDVRHWRDERRIRIGYNGERYSVSETSWTQNSFIQSQMMVQDRYFYDPVVGKYTVDRYLDDVEKRYGGIDAVLIWPTYPNMGIDDRNQHDLIRTDLQSEVSF